MFMKWSKYVTRVTWKCPKDTFLPPNLKKPIDVIFKKNSKYVSVYKSLLLPLVHPLTNLCYLAIL